ncbi:unnamed protein product, partial [Nesidiocoris tenuis]
MVKLPRRLNQPVKKEMEKRQHRSMYFHALSPCAYGCNSRNRSKIRMSGMGSLLVPDPT